MKKNISWKKLNRFFKRTLALTLVFALFFTIRFPERVYAETADSILVSLVRSNLAGITKATEESEDSEQTTNNGTFPIDKITDAQIRSIFKSLRSGNASWDTVSIVTTIERVAAEAEITGQWTVEKNGKDYTGGQMATTYTMGDLMAQYARQNISAAAAISESVVATIQDQERTVDGIVEIYDNLTEEKDDPFIDLDKFAQTIQSATAGASIKSYADSDFTDAINAERYTTYRAYTVGSNRVMPGGTLFVGTWLMDAQAINDTMYRMAVDSMTNDNQQIMYYKSELASNRWRDIMGATGLEYILPAADTISETELLDYFVSVVVGSDGIPRDPKTNAEIDIFNMTSPYDTYNLPELRGLRMMYDSNIVAKNGSMSDQFTWQRLFLFFKGTKAFTRSDQMETYVKYMVDVFSRPGTSSDPKGVAFMAYSGDREGIRQGYRHQESGKGFLAGLQEGFEEGTYENTTFTWTTDRGGWFATKQSTDGIVHYGDATYPVYTGSRRLIRGPVRWTGEKAWVAEMNAAAPDGKGEAEINRRIHAFGEFWLLHNSLHDDITDAADVKVSALNGLYSSFSRAGERENADMIMLVQERADADRRAECYYNLALNENHNYVIGPTLNFLLQEVTYGTSNIGEDYKIKKNVGSDYASNSSIVSMVQESLTNCSDAYTKYYGRKQQLGNTIASQLEYDLTNAIISKAGSGISAIRSETETMVDVENIQKDVVAHKSRELTTLNTLMNLGDTKFQQSVHVSANEDYRNNAADPETTEETLRKILQNQKSDASAAAAELQQFIRARVIRMDKNGAVDFIHQRINWADGLKSNVSSDPYGKYATEAINEHIQWLTDLLNKVTSGSSLDDEKDLNDDRVDYENELLDALDNDDDGALNDINDKLDKNADDLQNQRNKNKAILDGDGDAASKADALNELDGPEKVAEDLADKLLNDINNDDLDRVGPDAEALKDLGSNRLPEILDALKAVGAPNKLQNQIQDLIDDPTPGLLDDDGFGNGNGDGNGNGAGTGEGGDGDGSGDGGGGLNGDDTDGNNRNGDDDYGDGGPNGPGGDDGSGGDNQNGNNNPNGNTGGNGGNGGFGDGDGGDGGGDLGDGNPSGLDDNDLNKALNNLFGNDFNNLSDADKAASVAGLSRFANARDDDSLRKKAMELLEQLLAEGNGFIYRQYLSDTSQQYVSLAAVDNCRRYTKFRWVTENGEETMSQIAGGSASYVYEIGKNTAEKNNGSTDSMDTTVKKQTDPSIRGSRTAEYPYLTETYAGRYLSCSCQYITGTEWAILLPPYLNKKMVELLETLDQLADVEGS